jgi:hypothetical protein
MISLIRLPSFNLLLRLITGTCPLTLTFYLNLSLTSSIIIAFFLAITKLLTTFIKTLTSSNSLNYALSPLPFTLMILTLRPLNVPSSNTSLPSLRIIIHYSSCIPWASIDLARSCITRRASLSILSRLSYLTARL